MPGPSFIVKPLGLLAVTAQALLALSAQAATYEVRLPARGLVTTGAPANQTNEPPPPAAAAAATLTMAPFAETTVGSSTTAVASLTNSGNALLSLTVPNAASVSGTAFSFVSTTCSASLAAGQSCEVVVRFAPSSAEVAQGALAVTTAAGVRNVALSAGAVQGGLTVSVDGTPVSSVDLGVAYADAYTQTFLSKTFTVTNSGPSAVTGVYVSRSPANSMWPWSQPGSVCRLSAPGQTLEPGQSCTLLVRGRSLSTPGVNQATVTVNNSSGLPPTNVAVSVTTVAIPLTLSVPAMPDTVVGQSSTVTATLTNNGTAPAAFTSSAYGVFSTDASACGATLAPGASCSLAVTFNPGYVGLQTGRIYVPTDHGTVSAAVSASGLWYTADYSTGTLDFEVVRVGAIQQLSVQLTNNGGAPLPVTSVDLVGPQTFSAAHNCGPLPGSLAAHSSCVVTVTYAPQQQTSQNGYAHINTGRGTFEVQLYGAGGTVELGTNANVGFSNFVKVGESAETGTIYLINAGNVAATGLQFPAPTQGLSVSQSTCTSTLAAGQSCSYRFRFSPTFAGTVSPVMTFTSNESSASIQVYATAVP